MDSLPLTHPIERLLLGITLVAFLGVVYWKAGEPFIPRRTPTPMVQS